MTNNISVLILAGTRHGEKSFIENISKNISHKAFLPINNIPMIDYVISALRKVPSIGKIYVSIDPNTHIKHLENINIIESKSNIIDSLLYALEIIKFPCLITTADHVLLSPELLNEFIHKSLKNPSDLTIGIALKEKIQKDVPETKRTYINLLDKQFSGTNLFFLKNKKVIPLLSFWKTIQAKRKNPLKMGWAIGLPTLIKAFFKLLTTHSLIKTLKNKTGTNIDFIEMSSGLAAVDVDKIEDYYLVEKIIKNRLV